MNTQEDRDPHPFECYGKEYVNTALTAAAEAYPSDKDESDVIGYEEIKLLYQHLYVRTVSFGSKELFDAIDRPAFYKRMDDIWPDVTQQSKFLWIISTACSTTEECLSYRARYLLFKVFNSKLLEDVMNTLIHTTSGPFKLYPVRVCRYAVNDVVEIMKNGFELLPPTLSFDLSKIRNVLRSLKRLPTSLLSSFTSTFSVSMEKLEYDLNDKIKVAYWDVYKFCDVILQCGHACNKRHHHWEDANHANYKCFKRCERLCNTEFRHACEKYCYQECRCPVMVKKLLSCGHEKMDYCHLNEPMVQCDESCPKFLQCGHRCKEKCGAPCTTICHENVQKEWPLCNHLAETTCCSNPDSSPCPEPCNTVLPDCQHLCKGTCGSCRNGRLHIACSVMLNKRLICEHESKYKCTEACQPCNMPCETVCFHSVCGAGPPTAKYSAAFIRDCRKCGERCPPCEERCLNKCDHHQCSKKCGEICDVDICMQPCMKLLPCGNNDFQKHQCIGMCGEDCPKICKICNAEEFKQILQDNNELFGDEYANKKSRFVILEQCGHFIEVHALDKWVKLSVEKTNDETDSNEIALVKCPQCKTIIRRSKRYNSYLSEIAIDIEVIKTKNRGLTDIQMGENYADFAVACNIILKDFKSTCFGTSLELEKLKQKFIGICRNVVTENWLSKANGILSIVQSLEKYAEVAGKGIDGFENIQSVANSTNSLKKKLGEFKISTFWNHLSRECDNLIAKLDPIENSEFTLRQISFEVQRFACIVDVFCYLSKAMSSGTDFNDQEIQILHDILQSLYGSNEFREETEKQLSQKLQELADLHPVSNFGISQKERIEIAHAMKGHITHWYKCPNGHHYGIGECGQAMQKSKCPECKAEVGGEAHALLTSNQEADHEMLEGTGIADQENQNPFEARW